MASKITPARLPKIAPLPQTPVAPKTQLSVQSQIFRNNRSASRVDPLGSNISQRYPKFMGRTY